MILRYANIPSSSSCLEFRSLAQRFLVISTIVSFCRSVVWKAQTHPHRIVRIKNVVMKIYFWIVFIDLTGGPLSQECFTFKWFRFVYIVVKRHLNSLRLMARLSVSGLFFSHQCFYKPHTTFLTWVRGESRKIAGKKVFRSWVSNLQP